MRKSTIRLVESAECGLKDPLFLASSVFVKKPGRVITLSFVMVLCLLVYRLAEQLLAGNRPNPSQSGQQTDQPPHDALDFPMF